MKKLLDLSTPVKAFASMLFAGFICLYLIIGILYRHFFDSGFLLSMSFGQLLTGILFTAMAAVSWGFCYSRVFLKKWVFLKRYLLFIVLILSSAASQFFVFAGGYFNWPAPWFFVVGLVSLFVILLSYFSERHFRKISIDYTKSLRLYQRKINEDS